jgi:hypothetical protein
MIKFINPAHVPGSGSRPWITLQDSDELKGLYSQLSSWILNEPTIFGTDGYILRDTYAMFDTVLQQVVIITQLLNTQLNLDQTKTAGTVATFADLSTLTPSVGQWARVLADETPVDFSGGAFGPDPYPNTPTYWGNIYEWNGATWTKIANETKLYYAYHKANGHLSIKTDVYPGGANTDLLDPYRIKVQMEYTNTANKLWTVGQATPVQLSVTPEPNKIITIPVASANDFLLGDTLIVYYQTPTGPKTLVGLITSLGQTTTGVLVICSELSAGGVQQYDTFNDFPTVGLKEILYIDMSNYRPYTWEPDSGTYKAVTPDVSGKADKYTDGQGTVWNLDTVYNFIIALKQVVDADNTALEEHIANGGIHVTQIQKDAWTQNIADLATHIGDNTRHFDIATGTFDPTYDKIRKAELRDHLKTVNMQAGVPDGTPHLTPDQKTKITNAATQAYVDQELGEVHKDIEDIQEVIAGLSGLGRYLKTVDNYSTPAAQGNTTLLEITYDELFTEFPGAQVNDFMNIRTDEQHNDSSARYILSGIDHVNKTLTWQFDVLLNQNLNFLMDAFSDGDYQVGYIPTVTGQNTMSGKSSAIDPATLSKVADLNAHIAATGTTQESIHVSGADRIKWDKAISDLVDHEDDENVHLQTGERTAWNKVVSDFATHDADNVRHITAAERTAWNAKVDGSALEAEVARATGVEADLAAALAAMRDKGLYLGTVFMNTNLPTTAGTLGYKVGDWMFVEQDATIGGNAAAYRISAIGSGGTGTITWVRDMLWRNTSVDIQTYRRTLTVGGNWNGASAMPDITNYPNCYVDVYFAEEDVTLRIIASAGASSSDYLGGCIQYLKAGKEQRMGYAMNSQYAYVSWGSYEDPSSAQGMNSEDGRAGVFNFGNGTDLNTWIAMNDRYGCIYHMQEINDWVLSFPLTGNVFIMRILDTVKTVKKTKYVNGDKVTIFFEVRKANAPDLDVSLDPSYKTVVL